MKSGKVSNGWVEVNNRLLSMLFLPLMVVVLLHFSADAQRRIKVMPLGTSITAACNDCPSYRYFLWKTLVDSGLANNVDFVGIYSGVGSPEASIGRGNEGAPFTTYKGYEWDWDHNGIPSVTIPVITARIVELVSNNIPDVALVELGTNDLFGIFNADTTCAKMEKLIDILRSYNPSMRILIGKLIPMSTYSSALQLLNQKYVEMALRKSTPQSPVAIVDQYTGFNSSTMLLDALHPNTSGQQFMATKWSDALVPVIKSMAAAPSVSINTNGQSVFEAGKPVTVIIKGTSFPGIKNLRLLCNSKIFGGEFKPEGMYTIAKWTPATAGTYTLSVEALDYFGKTGLSAPLSVQVTAGVIVDKTIMEIQGNWWKSPVNGWLVRTTGVVTLVSNDSTTIWIQDTLGDNKLSTSDAVALDFSAQHKLGMAPPSQGDFIRVTGVVQEYRTDLRNETITRITAIDSIVTISTGNSLPKPVFVDNLPDRPSDGPYLKEEFEKREGMLFRLTNAIVAAPVNESGEWAVALTNDHYYSSCHFPVPYGSIFINYPWDSNDSVDYNTECLLIGTPSGSKPVVHPGDTVFECVGVLDYKDGQYLIQPLQNRLSLSASKPIPAVPVGGGSFHTQYSIRVTSVNLGGLFDTLDATDIDEPVLSNGEINLRIEKIANAVKNELMLPEVICIQGIENQSVFSNLANRVNQIGNSRYQTAILPSTNSSGLNCGILFDSIKCQIEEANQITDSSFASEGCRPLDCVFFINGSSWHIINFILADRKKDDPLFGINQPPARNSEELRNKQALAVRKYINELFIINPNAKILITGLFNDYPFNEGGELRNPDAVVSGDTTAGEKYLKSAWNTVFRVDPWNWYTELNKGRFQMTSDILISPALSTRAKKAQVIHFNTGFDPSFSKIQSSTIKAFKDDPIEIRF